MHLVKLAQEEPNEIAKNAALATFCKMDNVYQTVLMANILTARLKLVKFARMSAHPALEKRYNNALVVMG